MKISAKYDRIAKAYLYFACSMSNLDVSRVSKEAMYAYETHGHLRVKYNELNSDGKYNGYAVGKHWMDVTLSMWKEDIHKGILTKYELYCDPDIPDFIKQIVKKF